MSTHVAVITRPDSGFRATFPNFPDLVVAGLAIEEIRSQARRALEERLATIPLAGPTQVARALDEVFAEATEAVAVLEVAVASPRSAAVRINITIREDLPQVVDRAAKAHSMSRSRFLAKAVEAVVTGYRHQGIQIPSDEKTLVAVDQAARVLRSLRRSGYLDRHQRRGRRRQPVPRALHRADPGGRGDGLADLDHRHPRVPPRRRTCPGADQPRRTRALGGVGVRFRVVRMRAKTTSGRRVDDGTSFAGVAPAESRFD